MSKVQCFKQCFNRATNVEDKFYPTCKRLPDMRDFMVSNQHEDIQFAYEKGTKDIIKCPYFNKTGE